MLKQSLKTWKPSQIFQQKYFKHRAQYNSLNFDPQMCRVTSICLITHVQNKNQASFRLEASFDLLEAVMGNGAPGNKLCPEKKKTGLNPTPQNIETRHFFSPRDAPLFPLKCPPKGRSRFCFLSAQSSWYLALLRILKDTEARP